VFVHGRYDIGQKLDFLRANIEIALDRPDLGPELADYLRQLAKERLS
jgi:UTP--glucose-1-phosphate uridylyltransferase